MRIYVLGIRGFPDVQGGAEKHCEALYPRIEKKDFDITVLTRKPYIRNWRQNSSWKNINFRHLWSPTQKSLEAIIHTFWGTLICIKSQPDIVHVHNIGPGLFIPLLKLFGLKTVLTYHSENYLHQKWGKIAKIILLLGEKTSCTYADEIITVSKNIQKHIKEKFDRNSHCIPNGVAISPKITDNSYLNALNIKSGKYILSVSRFVPEKGLHHLINTYSKLDTDWQLVIAGDADHETNYSKKLKSQAKHTPGVCLTGYITGEQLNQVFSDAGLFVLPSYYEGHPIALLEALSYGLSVLVSKIPAHTEINLAENRYFKLPNEDQLAEKLNYFIKKGRLSERESTEQIEYIKKTYDWDNVADKVAEIYTEMMK
ncbi:MAG: glycosyltransferase family 4 protein [Bacteroidales bacterium]|nr:glycosyltransferase family 4 protein [Bacteroidales bacterium]